jgi:tetratricopeptide (TPR) repeat protein
MEAAAVFSATVPLTDTLRVRVLWGESLLAAGVYTTALPVFDEALPLATPSETARVLVGQARALLGSDRPDEAHQVLGSALDFATSSEERAEILRWRAQAYLALEAYDEALANLAAAEELDHDPRTFYWRGRIYAEWGQVQQAAKAWGNFLAAVDLEQVDPALVADAEERLDSLESLP